MTSQQQHDWKRRLAFVTSLLLGQEQRFAKANHVDPVNVHQRWLISVSGMASLASLVQNGNHQCLGTLIAPDIVLSAAHCFNVAIDHVLLGNNESYAIDSVHTHPQYFYNDYTGGIDVDPYDAVVVKLVAESQEPLMTLNREPERPVAGQILVGVGWNNTTPSEDWLRTQETTLLYIDNQECATINGTASSGDPVDMAGQVIDVSLCALYSSGPGLCRGDSGGPLMVNGLQVGIISANFGCADPFLPTLNVRVSEILDWLDTMLCTLALQPPVDVVCEPPTTAPAPTPLEWPFLTIVIQLDDYPTETGYRVELVRDDGDDIVVNEAYPGTFSEAMASTQQELTVQLLPASEPRNYRFTMTDNEHDGLTPGFYKVWLGLRTSLPAIISGGDFYLEDGHVFHVPVADSPAPSPNAAHLDGESTSAAATRSVISYLFSLFITG